MPEFAPGESKVAIATFPVKPAGLSCSAELWLALNGSKVATSGIKLFTSTGVKQDISFPITMPGAEGSYPVYLDIFTNGLLIGAYKAVEDVVIAVPAPVPFTFSNVSCEKLIMESAPAWETMNFFCTITNPNNFTVTELLKVMVRFKTTDYTWWSFNRTLGAGQSYNFRWYGNTYGQRDPDAYNGPLIARRSKRCMFLEDEWGNRSAICCVTGSG